MELNEEIGKYIKIEIIKFIRECKSAQNIYEKINSIEGLTTETELYDHDNKVINYKFVAGISLLRSILDKQDFSQRIELCKMFLKYYLPKKLFNLIINYQNVTFDKQECPFKKISITKESKEVSDSKNLQKKCNIQKKKLCIIFIWWSFIRNSRYWR